MPEAVTAASELLSEEDLAYLERKAYRFEASREGNVIILVINDYPLPTAYRPTRVDLLLRLPVNFPVVPADMFWTSPVVTRADGAAPQNTESRETHLARTWQRWSRHTDAAQWRANPQSLQSFLGMIQGELAKGI